MSHMSQTCGCDSLLGIMCESHRSMKSTLAPLPEAVREQIERAADAVLLHVVWMDKDGLRRALVGEIETVAEAAAQQERAYWRDRAKLLAEGFHQANRNTGNRPCANHEFADCPAEVCANNLVWLASHPPSTPEDR